MRIIKRHKSLTFLLIGLASVQGALASYNPEVASSIFELLSNVGIFLIQGVQNTWVRQGLSFIFLTALFYNIFDAIILKIEKLSSNSNKISMSLAFLSTLGLYYRVPADKISNLFFVYIILVIIFYLIKRFLMFSGFLQKKYNEKEVKNAEKNAQKEVNHSRFFENRLIAEQDRLDHELSEEKYEDKKIKHLLQDLDFEVDNIKMNLDKVQKDVTVR